MKGPILCAALCAALFHGGCGESSTEHSPLMNEDPLVFEGLFPGSHELKEEQGGGMHIFRDQPFEDEMRGHELKEEQGGGIHIFRHQPYGDEMRGQDEDGFGLNAEAIAATVALRRAASQVPELAEALGSKDPDVVLLMKRWLGGKDSADAGIYFHDEKDPTWGFLSNFVELDHDVTLSVRWLRQEVGAAAIASIGEEHVSFFCSEQIFMYLKALVMGDERSARQIAQVTSGSRNAMVTKDLGRNVTPYDEKLWARVRYTAMTVAVRTKFGVGEVGESLNALGEKLLMTRNALLVEAAPNDDIWGIGGGAKEGRAGAWQGLNLLGWVLMQVRAELRTASMP